jgi:hypothetical protein
VKPSSGALFHFSEEPDIREFMPRPAPILDGQEVVFAIDKWHAPLYYLPRDCPRVTFWPLPASLPEHVDRWFGHVAGRMVIAIEAAWLDRLRSTALYAYVFHPQGFESLRDHGVHVSRRTVRPERVQPVGDLLSALTGAGVELRVCQSLVPLGHAIVQTSLHWSLIRMRNAAGWTAPDPATLWPQQR